MHIESIMDMGAQAKSKAEFAPGKKTEHGAFQLDMQRAVKKAEQPLVAAIDAQASEPEAVILETEIPDEKAYEDVLLQTPLQQDEQEADDATLGALIAFALPIASAPINEKSENIEAAPTEQAQAIPMLRDDEAMPRIAPLQEEHTLAQTALTEEPLQEGEPTQDASFAAYIRGEIQEAVVSNEAERTVRAQTQELEAQEAPEEEASVTFIKEDESVQTQRVYDQNKTEAIEPRQDKTRVQEAQPPHTATQVFQGAREIDASALSDESAAIPREAQESFFSELLERVEVAAGEKDKALFVQLKPETLGGLSIRLTMNEEGMYAQVKTSSRHLQTMIHAELSQLTNTLRERGVEIVHMELIYDPMYGGNPQGERDGAYQQQDGSKARLRKIYAADAQAPLEQLYETMIPIDIADSGAVEYQA